MGDSIYLGFDVGSGSVRCLAVQANGIVIGSESVVLDIRKDTGDIFEQNSDQIWEASCAACRTLLSNNCIDPCFIRGIGFDATCSLVVLDKRGGIISPEMQLPKLLWIKENLNETWKNAGHFMDLADFMTFRATNSTTRSLCTVVCKWLIEASPEKQQWNKDFMHQIGLSELLNDNSAKIGSDILVPGAQCGLLSESAAKDLGLVEGIAVGVGIIDAHAGVLGTVACKNEKGEIVTPDKALTIICGTSTCHMALSTVPRMVNGIWGPYYGAILEGHWLNEGGQSAVGSVLDMLVSNANTDHQTMCQLYHKYYKEHGLMETLKLAEQIDVWPDYHGNRSPFANPNIRGAIIGLSLPKPDQDSQLSNLSMYVAHCHALAYMTKLIMQHLQEKGHNFLRVHLCGGLQNNPIYVQSHADVLAMDIVVANTNQPVALGAAMLGACASADFASLTQVAKSLAPNSFTVNPTVATSSFHQKKFERFKLLADFMRKMYS